MSAPGGWVLVKIEGEEAERKAEIKRGAYLAGQLAREIGIQLEKEKEVEEGRMEGEGRRLGGSEEGMGAPVLCTVSSGGGQIEFTFSSRSKFKVRACHQLSQLLGLQTDNRDSSSGRREEAGGWTPSTPIEGVGWGVTGKGWMCLSVEAGLSSAWVEERLRGDVLRQTSLPSGCVRACPGAHGVDGRVVLECRAVGSASLKTVWNAVESLVKRRREAEGSGGGRLVLGGALGDCVDLRVYVSPCPPPSVVGRLGAAMGGCKLMLRGLERAEYWGESSVCDSVVLPAASSYISPPAYAFTWLDISAPSASASCTGAELKGGDALTRIAHTCTVPWVGAGMGRGAPLSLSLGGDVQQGQEGEEVVSLERSGAFRRTPQWEELKLVAPAAYAAYGRAGGAGKRGGYPTSFLGYRFADVEVVNRAKRLKAVLMKRRPPPGDLDSVGDALRRDLGLTCSLVLTQRKLQGIDGEEWPHGDEAVSTLLMKP